MAYSRNPTWQNSPAVATPITAAALENIEGGLVAAAGVADSNTTAIAAKYTKPSGGIPNSDLATPGGTVAAATTTTQGIVKLAGDFGGTADLPTVPGLAGKEPAISRTGASAGNVLGYDGTNLTFGAPVTAGPSYNMLPKNFKFYRKALGRVRSGTGSATIALVNDSVGVAGTDYTVCTGTLLCRRIAAEIAPCEQTWITTHNTATSIDPRVTLGTGWGDFSGFGFGVGTGSLTVTLNEGGVGGPATTDTVVVYGINGTFTASVDGGTSATWTANSSTIVSQTFTFASGSGHVLTVTGTGGIIKAINTYQSTRPVFRFGNFSISQSKASDWVASAAVPIQWSGVASVANADFTILDLGNNDSRDASSVTNYAANIASLTDRYSATGSVLLKSWPPSRADSGEAAQIPLVAQMAAVAKAKSVGFLDAFNRWESYEISNPLGLYVDQLHPNSTGASDITQAIISALRTL